MNLSDFKAIIDQAVKNAEECKAEVFVAYKKKYYEIREVHQYGIIPDVVIEIGEKLGDE